MALFFVLLSREYAACQRQANVLLLVAENMNMVIHNRKGSSSSRQILKVQNIYHTPSPIQVTK